MARTIDPTRPLFAAVGAGDLVVELARGYASDVQTRVAGAQTRLVDVQTRLAKADLEPTAVREQARTVVAERIDGLTETAKSTQKELEGRLNGVVAEASSAYGDLAARGQKLVGRIRRQQSTQQVASTAKTTTAKAKTAKTQTTKSAKSTAQTAKKSSAATQSAAKKTAGTAKSNAKSTTTAAKKTAEATTTAAGDAATKVGD